MLVDCPTCVDGTMEGGGTCTICGGDGSIDLDEPAFKYVKASHRRLVEGYVWSEMLDGIAAINAKTDTLPDDMASELSDIMDKCNDIKEKVDEIKEVVDEL